MNTARTTTILTPVLAGLTALLISGCGGATVSTPNQQPAVQTPTTTTAPALPDVRDSTEQGQAPGGAGTSGSATAPPPATTVPIPTATAPPGTGDGAVATLPPGFELPPLEVETPGGVATPLGPLHLPEGVDLTP